MIGHAPEALFIRFGERLKHIVRIGKIVVIDGIGDGQTFAEKDILYLATGDENARFCRV